MGRKTVAVIFGGVSTEHEISKISAATIMAAIPEDKYLVIPVYISPRGKWYLYDGARDNIGALQWEKYGTPAVLSPDREHGGLLRLVGDKFRALPVDIAFPVLHGANGEDGSLQGLLKLAGIPFVGSGVLSSALCMDKYFTKQIVEKLSIKQTKYLCFTKKELGISIEDACKKVKSRLGFPCYIKPANSGSSIGVSKAANKKELVDGLWAAAELDNKILVEKAVLGRELECAVLGNTEPEASAVGEIKPAADFYDFEAKYNNSESLTIVPADIPTPISEEIRNAAIQIYKALDCRGMARADFFLDENDKVIFNEINTIPGFTGISMYPMLWDNEGLGMSRLTERLIELGFEEFNGEGGGA